MKKRLEKQLADLQDKLPCAKALGRGRPVGATACSAPERNVMMLGILVKNGVAISVEPANKNALFMRL